MLWQLSFDCRSYCGYSRLCKAKTLDTVAKPE